ncbi:MAG TPA: hypothetical protein VKY74_04060 [Chloroflexia bacterium]|nr:hypothetical protein [Chloroflexia bacterium]
MVHPVPATTTPPIPIIGIVSVMSANNGIRIALLSHHWAALQAVSQTRDWAGLAAGGYSYAGGDRAFTKECGAAGAHPPADMETRKAWCQVELDQLAAVPAVGMYRQSVAQLARRGLQWHGRCLTEDAVATALGRSPSPAHLLALMDPRSA